MITLFSNPDLF